MVLVRWTMSRGSGVSRGRGMSRGSDGRGVEGEQRLSGSRRDDQLFSYRSVGNRFRPAQPPPPPPSHVMGFRRGRGTLYQPLIVTSQRGLLPFPPSAPSFSTRPPQPTASPHHPIPQPQPYTTRLHRPPPPPYPSRYLSPHPPPQPLHKPYISSGMSLTHRSWEVLERHLTTGGTVSVLTYNVLAQSLIHKNMYLYNESEALQWERRRELLLDELRESRSNLICLQEVDEEHYHDWFLPQLTKLGYDGVYKKRTGDHSDGCAVFYYTSHLKLEEWRAVEFQKKVKVLDRDNVAIVAKFQMFISRRKTASFCLANTHLLFNPKAGDVKLAQLVYLIAELNQLATPTASKPRLPYILCGDLNSLPDSPIINFIKRGSLDYKDLTRVELAGYFKKESTGGGGGEIPSPLFPPEVPINHNCQFISSSDNDQTLQESMVSSGINFSSVYPIPNPDDSSPNTSSHHCGSNSSVLSGTNSSSGTSQSGTNSPSGASSHSGTNSPSGPTNSPRRSSPHQSRNRTSITTYHHRAFEMVDYIHYTALGSPGIPHSPTKSDAIVSEKKTAGFKLLKRKRLIPPDRLREMGPQPHHLLPSDHNWLLAVFQYTT